MNLNGGTLHGERMLFPKATSYYIKISVLLGDTSHWDYQRLTKRSNLLYLTLILFIY